MSPGTDVGVGSASAAIEEISLEGNGTPETESSGEVTTDRKSRETTSSEQRQAVRLALSERKPVHIFLGFQVFNFRERPRPFYLYKYVQNI